MSPWTIYAIGAKGERCDVSPLLGHSIIGLSDYSWQCRLWDDVAGVTYQVFYLYDNTPLASYTGDYRIVTWEGEKHRPGILEPVIFFRGYG